jgi:hypothetical protein
MVARRVLEQDLMAALEEGAGQLTIPPRVFDLLAHARRLQLNLNVTAARQLIRQAVVRAVDLMGQAPTADAVARAVALVEAANRLGTGTTHWAGQNRFYALWTERADRRQVLAPLARALGFTA